MKTIPYSRQSINQDDIDAVNEVLRSDWLTQGPKIKGRMCECGIRIHSDKSGKGVCEACGAKYEKKGNEVSAIKGGSTATER